jgi:alkanesulfonate monooxygenase SsuD/methylene tetrahydromethanopterin reductase-like flavin-dependent oxidoreductase (luciferase family)
MRATLHLLPEGDATTPRGSLIGTLEEVRSAIRAYAAIGVNGFVLDTFYGSPLAEHKDSGQVLDTLQRFAAELIPEFQNNTTSRP